MANLNLFQTLVYKPALSMIQNQAKAPAYALSAEHALAQYAATGCLNDTYYASAEVQLSELLRLCDAVSPEFIVKTAVYCRQFGYMKDVPALLVAYLAAKSPAFLPVAFTKVIDNGKMLRTVVQIMRSGVTGRKSLGTRPKKLVQNWLNNASEQALLQAAVGNKPSLADVVKMVHPKPVEAWREAFFAWLLDKPYVFSSLPPSVQALEAYKKDPSLPVPPVPFQLLTALDLDGQAWASIALQAGWQMLRMNLNTFARHGVFQIEGMAEQIALKLRDAQAITKAKVFPYQLLTAYQAAGQDIPLVVREALQDALEIALANVPVLVGRVVICPDVSGSMHSPVTGFRAGASTATRCIDVAGLVAAAFLRQKRDTLVLPFEDSVVEIDLNTRDSVMTNAQKLANIGGGGTNCSAPLAWLNGHKIKADVIIMVSDNESWVDGRYQSWVHKQSHAGTETMRQWNIFKQNNPQAKLICIDIQPYANTQAHERNDILNIGGFSDSVFSLIAAFASDTMGAAHWLEVIKAVSLQQEN